MAEKIKRTEEEWRELLTPQQYAVLRQAGTERPFTGALLRNKESGVYQCGACKAPSSQRIPSSIRAVAGPASGM